MTPNDRAQVHGLGVDTESRCQHYHTERDIVAIKFHCCGLYWACYECHAALSGHEASRWPRAEWDTPAILCGACGEVLTIAQYMQSSFHCPSCQAAFNPGCARHYPLYFQMP